MAQADTMGQQAPREQRVDPNTMPLPKEGFFKKLEHGLNWFNQPSEGKYTLGAAFRKITFRDPSDNGLHLSRIGRLAERIITITGVVAACALGPANIGVVALLIAAKVAGAGGGAAVMMAAKGAEGMARKIDFALNKPKKNPEDYAPKKGLIGASEVNDGPVGARNANDMKLDDAVGASRKVDPNASIKQEFDGAAANPKAFDPKGPKPLESYGLGAAVKKQAGMKNGG